MTFGLMSSSGASLDGTSEPGQPTEVSAVGHSESQESPERPAELAPAAAVEVRPRSILADTAEPAIPVAADTRPVELGMRFSPTDSVTAVAIRFYKTTANEGPHTGSLWSSEGTLLARVAFAPAAREGWQSASLTAPVSLIAGQEYVVSYTATSGAYSADTEYFVQPRTVDGIRLPQGAGVYTYDAGGFPASSYRSANYFVDVTFVASAHAGTDEQVPDPAPPSPAAPTGTSALEETPSTEAEDPDTGSVELGMRFSPRVEGAITGIRFFKTPGNSGPHRGTLWDADGYALARVDFGETSTEGWQQAQLSSPVQVTPGEDYVVSYFAPHGRYAAAEHFFDRGFDSHYLSLPAGAGVYAYGPGGFPTENHENSVYYVDVLFVPTSTPSLPPVAPPAPDDSLLDLPREAWWGGPQYYSAFPQANASGWDEESFFPIAVFFGKPAHAAALAAVGVNTYLGAEHDGSPISDVTENGISVIAQAEWSSQEVGTDSRVVGWHVSDECDMGLSGCDSPLGELGGLAIQRAYVEGLRAKGDGRFLQANFGNGALGTYWSPTTMDDHVALMDVTSVDKYAYTSPHVQSLLRGTPSWPSDRNPASASAYGWQQDRMESFMSPIASKPNWAFVESARPYLTEEGARTISVAQIEGAVWNAIIHGAAGIAYFQHNNDGACGNYSLVECSTALRDGVAAINADVADLAPVINSPSYEWAFGSALDTALKAHGGSAYIFAMTDGGTGERTFVLPPGVTGTIEVVGENRQIRVSDGLFSDHFEAEYSHHTYRISLS
ncbi:DUF4082 domain-containing protein [Microbacterium sp. zg.Y909]|uniref:DUF4082 domain-containing protein n=1 Tax=Microbacterium sp. zg.Y909 TaxID=2969413 RepID=UPI00214BAE6A|nr:DUF4082 domain-containing protein [Microbacterium sp. zg.Y909]MCR2823913.1 DUF4082 domain-containing protein [Microbacterium sp. zg.Y909]